MTTVLSRGARARRSGRKPGWILLTVLLVLAIAASSALVFTNRVELLKLAVILALWAAVVAAFVSVIYRRQSDVDQARARDLKLVYDLQLDREISARREYELTVESQLRRELASELRSQAADEVAALRTELSTLRMNLEILFDADLEHHPALEGERATVRAYSDWDRAAADDSAAASRVSSSRVADMASDGAAGRTDQNPIIDVPEVGEWEASPAGSAGGYDAKQPGGSHGSADRGSHWPRPDDGGWSQDKAGRAPRPRRERYSQQGPSPPEYAAPEPQPEPRNATPPQQPAGADAAGQWQPVQAEGQWLPPGSPGSNWVSGTSGGPEREARPDDTADLTAVDADSPAADPASPDNQTGDRAARREAGPSAPPAAERRGRHAGPPEPEGSAPGEFASPVPSQPHGDMGRRAPSRHSAESESRGSAPAGPTPAPPPPAPAARHRSAEPDETDESPAGGQSVADLLARLQTDQTAQTGGGRRRRREE